MVFLGVLTSCTNSLISIIYEAVVFAHHTKAVSNEAQQRLTVQPTGDFM